MSAEIKVDSALAGTPVAFKSLQACNEANAFSPHRKGGSRKTVCLVNIWTKDGQTDNIGDGLRIALGIVNVLPANISSRGGNTAITDREYFDDFVQVEGITDSHAPVLSAAVLPCRLNIATRIDVEILQSVLAQDFCGVVDRPPFDNAGRIVTAIARNIEIAICFAFGLLCQRKDRPHIRTGLFQNNFPAIDRGDLAVLFVGAELVVDVFEIREDGIQHFF